MDESYEDPRYDSSQGRWVTYDADAGAVWEPLTVAAPLGQYVGTGDAGGQWQEYSPEERAAVAARQEADRLSTLQGASAYLAQNPLGLSGDQIDTRYGQRDVSYFNPLAKEGEAITGATLTQMIDPLTKAPVFLSNPNDPQSYTYENTGTPAIGGTLEQQAALYRPVENKGVFGTLGGDLLSAVKDPYFLKFAAAAAAMAGGAAFAAQGAGGAGAAGGVGAGGEAGSFIAADMAANAAGQGAFDLAASLGMPLEQAVSQGLITGSGALTDAGATALLGSGGMGSSTAGGFLGGSGDILAGAAGTGGGDLGASSFLSGLGNITPAQAFQAARLAMPVVGALTGGGTGAGGSSQAQPTTVMSSQGPWNTFLNPTMTRQEVTNQNPVFENPQLAMLDMNFDTATPSSAASYFNYGTTPQVDYFAQNTTSPLMAANGGKIKKPQRLAMGGLPVADNSDTHVPEFITGATGHYVKGQGDGQSDDIPAMLADGEYVFDADTVAQLGNGSSDAGAEFLDKFRHAVREHKRSAPVDKIPPKASPLQYVKEAMKRT
jgi:hypothetical protein